ncbi:GtrA family protein [Sphingobacterium oryzagri]|uniref:GtrA family protein n=1 Tax=Sphingobacterium oryzagri TaxID=3025669 RepID=A0ABY7WCM9_9SPHI|nr:GtrA family protein [Sphingobacterium sp. KACC 22765]WDF67413.1 GtrA family protein [Sphingobacterium sp. KACC 22765]
MGIKQTWVDSLLRKLYDISRKFVDLKFFDFQKFKYLLLGCSNVGLSWLLYFLCYNFVVQKQNVNIFLITISPHIFSFIASFIITFFTGFFLNYHFVFQKEQGDKRLKRKLLKYFLSTMGSFLINYLLLKLFVEQLGWYPTPSQMLATCIVTVYSYLAQQKFTFAVRTKKTNT